MSAHVVRFAAGGYGRQPWCAPPHPVDPKVTLAMHESEPVFSSTTNSLDKRIGVLIEQLALAGIDVERERCDPVALRLTAANMLELALLLEAPDTH